MRSRKGASKYGEAGHERRDNERRINSGFSKFCEIASDLCLISAANLCNDNSNETIKKWLSLGVTKYFMFSLNLY